MCLNIFLSILNNITYIFIYVFTHTYIKNTQTTLLKLLYQTPPKFLTHCINFWKMLANAISILVNNLKKKKINITFLRNEKNYQNINFFFLFLLKFSWTRLLINTLKVLINITLNFLPIALFYFVFFSFYFLFFYILKKSEMEERDINKKKNQNIYLLSFLTGNYIG